MLPKVYAVANADMAQWLPRCYASGDNSLSNYRQDGVNHSLSQDIINEPSLKLKLV